MRLLRITGSLLTTAGIVVLLFTAYELWGTSLPAGNAQRGLDRQLQRQWAAGPAAPAAPASSAGIRAGYGQPFAVLTIPRLGPSYRKVILEGIGTTDLQKGPGHYPGTAMPGQVGDFAVAGHRTTYGAPFADLDRLRPGDSIDVEVHDATYVYSVTASEIVRPSDVGVVAPDPDHAGVAPTRRMLTFTTCHPKYSANKRLVVHAVLATVHRSTTGG
jgi:sortase A